MRRTEFAVARPELEAAVLREVMDTAGVGYLGLLDEAGYPRVVPLNFVYQNECVYFHGALDGEKFEIMSRSPRATFSADIPYALIPSYWVAKDFACPATTLFKATLVRGWIRVVEDVGEKASMLQGLMEKYQPEGGYRPITLEEPLYRTALTKVAVFRLEPEHVSVKSKFQQHKAEKVRREIANRLLERDQGRDRQAAEEILRTLEE